MHRENRTFHPQIGHFRQTVGAHFREPAICGHDGQRGVLPSESAARAAFHGALSAGQLHAVGRAAGPRNEPAGFRIAHIAERIHRHQRSHTHGFRQAHGERSDAGLHRLWHAEDLAHGRACPCADSPLLHSIGGGAGGSCLAHLARGSYIWLADCQVEQDGAGHNRHDGRTGWKTHATVLQIAANSRSGFQAERAAARQDYGVHAVSNMRRAKDVDFFGTSRGATDIHAAHGSGFAENHGASGERVVIGRVSHANA